MKYNPFKFGTIVDGEYFTNRVKETEQIKSVLNSENHLVILSPRRYGKTSLITKVVSEMNRPYMHLDLQLLTGEQDLAEQLLKKICNLYPFQKVKQALKRFRLVPSLNINPLTNEISVSFGSISSIEPVLEDTIQLLDIMGVPGKKLIVIFDEFQDILRLGSNLDRKLRSLMQFHKNVNYIFLGSQESMIRELFEKKKSPFFNFGQVMPLSKIPCDEFSAFLIERLKTICSIAETLADQILMITSAHPFYTQQLAFNVWNLLSQGQTSEGVVDEAVKELIQYHDADYERLWNTLISTDRKILIGMAMSDDSPLSNAFTLHNQISSNSTIFSGLKRLMTSGFVCRVDSKYQIDDPFFVRWIIMRRNRI